MFSFCDYCLALLAEMGCHITEAHVIQEDIQAHLAASIELNRNSPDWYRNAMARWNDAATELAKHMTPHETRLTLAAGNHAIKVVSAVSESTLSLGFSLRPST
jgi:hypothetical protein